MKKLLTLICAVTLLSLLAGGAVLASGSRGIPQDNYTRPSRAFDVGMMFYKMVGAQPSFESWITASKQYKGLPQNDQAAYLARENARLNQEFAGLDIKKAAVVVRTVVKVEVISRRATSPGEAPTNVLRLDLPPDNEVYFPYQVGDQMIAVIPNGVELYREIPLTAAEAAAIRSRLDVSGKVTLVLEIPPKMADGKAPVTLNNIPQWLLIGEIGFLGIYNSSTDVLWSYQAPYYAMQGQDILLDLRSNRAPANLNSLKTAPAVQP